jgi:hypothetical protein
MRIIIEYRWCCNDCAYDKSASKIVDSSYVSDAHKTMRLAPKYNKVCTDHDKLGHEVVVSNSTEPYVNEPAA